MAGAHNTFFSYLCHVLRKRLWPPKLMKKKEHVFVWCFTRGRVADHVRLVSRPRVTDTFLLNSYSVDQVPKLWMWFRGDYMLPLPVSLVQSPPLHPFFIHLLPQHHPVQSTLSISISFLPHHHTATTLFLAYWFWIIHWIIHQWNILTDSLAQNANVAGFNINLYAVSSVEGKLMYCPAVW